MRLTETISVVIPFLLLAATSGTAKADAIFEISQAGSDVVATGSGSIDLTGLTVAGSGGGPNGLIFGTQIISGGSAIAVGEETMIYAWEGSLSGNSPIFATGGQFTPDSTSGDTFALVTNYPASGSAILDLPQDYVSGSSFSGTATWNNTTLASLDLLPGTYTYTVGDNTITLDIGSGPSTPEPATFFLLAGGMAILSTRRFSRVLLQPGR